MAEPFPFTFSSDGLTRDEFIRVLGQIASRLHKTQKHPGPDALHDVRTVIKLLRSLLWLARPELTQTAYDSAKKNLRTAAEMLSGPRDAAVVRARLEGLQEEASKTQQREALQLAREKLAPHGGQHAESRTLVNQSSSLVQKTIHEVLRQAASAGEWKPSKRRLKKAFAQTCEARHLASSKGKPACYHEWRKKAKRLLYLLQVLSKTKEAEPETIKCVDEIQHELGDYHDSVVLQAKLKEKFSSDPREVKPVLKLLRKQQRKLRRKAGRIARKIDL